jgi:hypothetical protein
MVRRFICLGVILLLILLNGPACDSDSKTKKAQTVQDPDSGAKPAPAGGVGAAKGG